MTLPVLNRDTDLNAAGCKTKEFLIRSLVRHIFQMKLTIICQMSNYFYHKMTVGFLFGHKSVILDL